MARFSRFMPRFSHSVALALAAFMVVTAIPAALGADKPMTKTEIEKIVRDYLIAHPEVILEAIQSLESKEQAAAEQESKTAVLANRKSLEESAGSPVGGNPKGDIILIEFFDYNCGYCKQTHPERAAAVKGDGKIKVIYKEFPILSPTSVEAAKYALAAARQRKYEEIHAALMGFEGRLNTDAIRSAAKDVGLDMKKLESDMSDPAIQAEIDANIALARTLGIRGTPAFIVGDTLIPGAISTEQFVASFGAARAAKKSG